MSELSEGRGFLEPWLRVGAIVLSQAAAIFLVVVLFRIPGFAALSGTTVGMFMINVVGLLTMLAAVVFYERLRGAGEVWDRLGFRRPGRDVVNFAIGGVIYGLVACYLLRNSEGLAKAGEHWRFFPRPYEGSLVWSLYVIFLLSGTVVEEIFMRGFLFRSFLKNYGLAAGTGCVVVLGMLMHWSRVSASLGFLGFLVVLQAGLCLVWWKKRNLWYCIAVHGGFNLAVLIFPAVQQFLSGRH